MNLERPRQKQGAELRQLVANAAESNAHQLAKQYNRAVPPELLLGISRNASVKHLASLHDIQRSTLDRTITVSEPPQLIHPDSKALQIEAVPFTRPILALLRRKVAMTRHAIPPRMTAGKEGE